MVVSLPVVAAVPTAMAGGWFNNMLKGFEKALKTKKKDLSLLAENSTKVNIGAMKTIKKLANNKDLVDFEDCGGCCGAKRRGGHETCGARNHSES